jgi:2-hydroxy-6-oxonona-2,4-dienedioate hydrolase
MAGAHGAKGVAGRQNGAGVDTIRRYGLCRSAGFSSGAPLARGLFGNDSVTSCRPSVEDEPRKGRALLRVYEERVGQGPPVVFLPGAGWSATEGLVVAERLADRYTVALVDLPGYGRSASIDAATDAAAASWVAQYLDQRGWNRCHLVGHSLGGYVALACAALLPERVVSLTLLDAGHLRLPRWQSIPGPLGLLVPLVSLSARFVGPERLMAALSRVVGNTGEERSLDERVAAAQALGWYRLPDDRYLRAALQFVPRLTQESLPLMLAFYRADPPRLMAQLTVPTVLFYSADPATPLMARRAEEAARRIERVNRAVLAVPVAGGHYVHWVDEAVVEAIRCHIDTVEAGRVSGRSHEPGL